MTTTTANAETAELHDFVKCPVGRIESYQRIDLGDVIVQVGICVGCREAIARRYVVTGPGTGPWVVLSGGAPKAALELAGDGLPFCSCEVEDDGDGESGPHLSITRLDEDCPRHGREATTKGAV